MSDNFNKLNVFLEKAAAYQSLLNLCDYDIQVSVPEGASEQTASMVGIISDEYRNIFVNKNFAILLKKCMRENDEGILSSKECVLLREAARKYYELKPIPSSEYRAFCELTSRSIHAWSKAKNKDSFKDFAPILEEIVEYKRKFASYRKRKHQKAYNVLLEDYEPGFTIKKVDKIFDEVKEELIPLIKRVTKRQEGKAYTKLPNSFDEKKLEEFCIFLSKYLLFDMNNGVIAHSEHPFTINLHNKDVRITNNFSKGDLFGPIFSAIHETGHALYEQGIDQHLTGTLVGEGTSMGMHESQSRFYENMIGKQMSFWKPLFPKLKEIFPEQLAEVTWREFLHYIDRVSPGPIRIDADELTYPIHIIIRYELEKKLISGKMEVNDLPKEWNRLYKKYLGVKPKDDAEGVLQDVHWAAGEFGYFPSYLIGSAVAAQIYYHMKDTMPFDQYLLEGDLRPIREYLRENIHKYGKALKTNELLDKMMGEEFSIKYYIRYLKEKWGDE